MTILEAITTPSKTTARPTSYLIIAKYEELATVHESPGAAKVVLIRDFALSLPKPAQTVALDELARRLEAWEKAQ